MCNYILNAFLQSFDNTVLLKYYIEMYCQYILIRLTEMDSFLKGQNAIKVEKQFNYCIFLCDYCGLKKHIFLKVTIADIF